MELSQITYPSGLPWGKVEGRIARAYADAKDANALPDITPATTVRVTFTPTVRSITYTGGSEPIIISPEEAVCEINADGYLVGPDGKPGVVLMATSGPGMTPDGWAYNVTFTGAQIPSIRLALKPGETVNLATALPADPGAVKVETPDPETLEAVRALTLQTAKLISAPALGLVQSSQLRADGHIDPDLVRLIFTDPTWRDARTPLAITDTTAYAEYGAPATVERRGSLVSLDAAYSTTAEWKTGATLYTLPAWARPGSVQYQTTYDGARMIVLTNGEVKLYTPNIGPSIKGKRITTTWMTAN